MELFRAQRLRAFMDYLRSERKIYNDGDFCIRIKKNKGIVSEIVNGHRNLTPQFAAEVRAAFPELDPRWLIEKDCNNMLIGSPSVDSPILSPVLPASEPSSGSQDIVRLHKIIEKQQATIDRLLQIIERMQDGNGDD